MTKKAKQKNMVLSTAIVVLLSSLFGIPIVYLVNQLHAYISETMILLVGLFCLASMCAVVYIFRNRNQPVDPLYYVFSLCCFSSVVDIVIALELDGFISGFMTFYLLDGEPYLKSSHGMFINYWDGTAHYFLYLMMLAAMTYKEDFRSVGLYWFGSIFHSLFVLLPGGILGQHGPRAGFFLNIPFVVFPLYAGIRFFRARKSNRISSQKAESVRVSVWCRPMDMFFLIFCVFGIIVAFIRGFAALGGNFGVFKYYRSNIEPYIDDPIFFGRLQQIVYLAYFVPFYCACIWALLHSGCSWFPDWALVHAGAAAQAQFSYIGSAVHSRTPYSYRVPDQPVAQIVFWIVNLLLLVVPQLLAYRAIRLKAEFFCKIAKNSEFKSSDFRRPSSEEHRSAVRNPCLPAKLADKELHGPKKVL